ncbi:gamma-tubulin complex component 6-like isoform X2 [Penaeus chinensis]|uniref:gamma-tubulin complex component 6-like isoform X2 n=1 Tax=Penaeus chinensis TaxID=139456 RepID=UPI001FB5A410|nr:gamma-tubulin complex component 6-like isoform X2 [Penaeus chinensis]
MILPTSEGGGVGRVVPHPAPSSKGKGSRSSSAFYDVSPEDILKNLEKAVGPKDARKGGSGGGAGERLRGNQPATDSPLALVKELVDTFGRPPEDFYIRDKALMVAQQGRLKRMVYSTLLAHRKDYDLHSESGASDNKAKRSITKVTEVEQLIWLTYVLRQQRRFDDANSLDACLQTLKEEGHLEADSDVRNVLRFLVALAGCGEGDDRPTEAKITPRVVNVVAKRPTFLPTGPLHYGDTFLHSAEHGRFYMHFPAELFSPASIELMKERTPVSPMSVDSMLGLCNALPGTGISPLLLQENQFEAFGKAMGAMLQERSGELTPDAVLTLPELPSNPHGYCYFGHVPKSLPSPSSSAVGSDEGYASSRASSRHCPEEEKGDIWEAVLEGPPLTSRRTWENLGHPATTKEKLYLTETGTETSHRVWVVYQQLWGSFGAAHYVPSLQVCSEEKLCQDMLHLMVGLPSLNFPWHQETKSFSIREGLCCPGITPEPLRLSLVQFVECGSFVRRLETVCTPPAMYTRQVHIQGLVFRAFTSAVSNFLQMYRGMVLSLVGGKHLLQLQQKAQNLVKKVKFVAEICHISPVSEIIKTSGMRTRTSGKVVGPESSANTSLKSHNSSSVSQVQISTEKLPRGLSLIGELHSRLMVTKDRECSLLLVSILKATCVPFFRYLEEWVYEGLCSDPGLEFMIDVDGRSLLKRDRSYWTHGYTLRDLSDMPPFLREVLQEAYTCGKALNLLKLCSPKHHLVAAGGVKHPSFQLCISSKEMETMRSQCENYAAHMEYLAAKNQVTARQREEQLREEKKRLLAISAREHAAVIKEIEKRMNDVRQLEIERKRARFKELKEEARKAEERKMEEKAKEIELEKKIALEAEEVEKEKKQREEKLKAEIEMYYQKLMQAAERREVLSQWKLQRCLLSESRKKFIVNFKWSPQPENEAKKASQDDEEDTDTSDVTTERLLPLVKKLDTPSNTKSIDHLSPDPLRSDCIEPSPTEESVSAYDMTTSLMSTSSDIVDTPHDENLPELEVDSTKNINYDRNVADSRMSRAYMKSSIGSIIHSKEQTQLPARDRLPVHPDFSNVCNQTEASAIKKKVLEEEFGIVSTELVGAQSLLHSSGNETVTRELVSELQVDNGNLTAAEIRQRVLNEEYGIRVRDTQRPGDGNANFVLTQTAGDKLKDGDENGNTGPDDVNANVDQGYTSEIVTVQGDANANSQEASAVASTATVDPGQGCIPQEKTIMGSEDESNGNVPNLNEAFTRYRETCAEAAAIKRKVLSEEFQSSTTSRNTMNLLKSKAVTSSAAMENKKRVLDSEYGIGIESTSRNYRAAIAYERQVSGASTASYKSCLSYDRQTSGSTAFTTPDEERPILIDQAPAESPTSPHTDTTMEDDLLSARRLSVVPKVQPYSVEYLKLMDEAPLLNITGTALTGHPATVGNAKKEEPFMTPTNSELACLPIYFIRSIRLHLATQSRLVNTSLLSEVLVQESLIDHFSALRALLLLHDAHFARALTVNLFTKFDTTRDPATLLIPAELNSILQKSVADSCWSSSPLIDNLSFAITNIPSVFTHQTSILDCLELRYHVRWPHTLILDSAVLASYSRLWTFLASLHHSIWAADDLFRHTMSLSRQDAEGRFKKCRQFHQVCLFSHQMHHFLLVVQAYVISQVHQISWSGFEKKLHEKVTSLDDLYELHCSHVNSITSRCFLNPNGAVVLKLVRDVFALMLRFRGQLLSHQWHTDSASGITEHPGFAALQSTFKEFQKHATFLHKLLQEEESKLQEC